MTYPIHIYYSVTTDKPTLLFGHGNGFPPEAYAPLADALPDDYQKVCLPARPWWGDQSPEDFTGWHMLANDFVGGIREHGLAPVVGIGHSMSGVALTIAAVEHPELFKAIVLVDPVFLPRIFLRLTRVLKLFGYKPNQKLVEGARRRTRHWASMEEAYERFRKRSLFRNCSDDAVRRYTEGLLRPAEDGGVELAYSPEWEAAIFADPPLDEWLYPPKLKVPCLIIGADHTDVFFSRSVNLWRKMRPDVPVEIVSESSHLLPMEKPEAVAQIINQFLVHLDE